MDEDVEEPVASAAKAYEKPETSKSILDDTSANHPKNESINVSKFEASSVWEPQNKPEEETEPKSDPNQSELDKTSRVDESNNASIVHPKNESISVSKFEDSSIWDEEKKLLEKEQSQETDQSQLSEKASSQQQIDESINHPKNKSISMSKYEANSIWEPQKKQDPQQQPNDPSNQSALDNTVLSERVNEISTRAHPKNETINASQFDSSSLWEAEKKTNDESSSVANDKQAKPTTTTKFDDSFASVFHPKNKSINLSKFHENSIWEGQQQQQQADTKSNSSLVRKALKRDESINTSGMMNQTDRTVDTSSMHPYNKTVNISEFEKSSEWKPTRNKRTRRFTSSILFFFTDFLLK